MTTDVGGRPPYMVDYKVLKELCQMQCTGEECASVLGVDYDTLNRALKRESESGESGFTEYFAKNRAGGFASLRAAQFKLAVKGQNPTMQIWLGKQYLGQTDSKDITPPANDITVKIVNATGNNGS